MGAAGRGPFGLTMILEIPPETRIGAAPSGPLPSAVPARRRCARRRPPVTLSAMISDPVAVFLVLAVVVFVALQLEERYRLFRSLGAALVGILLGMALSNAGIIPGTSTAYDFLMGPGVNYGIALILLSVDLRSVVQAGPAMLAAFSIGAMGTAVGATVGALVFSGLVGAETWKLAGQFTGTYTGGGMNFAALGRALETSSDMFTAATAADVIVTAVWMAACLAVPVMLRRPRADAGSEPPAAPEPGGGGGPMTLEKALHSTGQAVSIVHAAALVMVAVAAVWAADTLAVAVPSVPQVLWLTTLVLAVAQVPVVKRMVGGALWGNYLVLLFLASNGARSVVANIFEVGPAVFYYAALTVAIHGLVIFGVGRLFRLDLATLAVASQANVGGAASAMALASARGYGDRLLPGVAVGLLGYAVGNYLGFAVAATVRSLIG